MRTATFAALALVLSCTSATFAQTVTLEFGRGQVSVSATDVPISVVLAEWSRIGGTLIVNGEHVPGPPVTLELVDVPELEALDLLLLSAAGYIAARREPMTIDGSAFGRIVILATSSVSSEVEPEADPADGASEDPADLEDPAGSNVETETESFRRLLWQFDADPEEELPPSPPSLERERGDEEP